MNNNYVQAQGQRQNVPVVQGVPIPTQSDIKEADILNNLNSNLQYQINNSGFSKTQIDRINSEESFLKQTILSAIIGFKKSNQMRNLVNNSRGPKFRELFTKRALLDLYQDPTINTSGISSGIYRAAKTGFYRFTPKMVRDPVYGAFFTKKRGGKYKKTRKNKH